MAASSPYLYAVGSTFVYALNTSSLAQVWKVKIASPPAAANLASSPAVSGGSVYVGSSDGKLWSLDALTGALNWKYTTSGPIYSSPVVGNGLVIFGSDDGNVYAVSTSTGQEVWSFQTGGKVRSSPSVSAGVVAVGSDDAVLYLINENTGGQIRNATLGGPIESSPNFAGNTVYIGSNDTNIYAVNVNNAEIMWQRPTGAAVIGSPVSTRDGRVIVGSLDGNLYSIDASNGQIQWTNNIGPIYAPVSLGEGVDTHLGLAFDDLAYVSTLGGGTNGTGSPSVYGIESDTGTIIWSKVLSGPVIDAPILAYTKLYVGDSSGTIYEIGALQFATPVNTFDQSGQIQGFFEEDAVITFGANVAWGKFGIQSDVNLTVKPPGQNPIPLLSNVSMFFVPGQNFSYNFYYTWDTSNLNLAPGTYKVSVSVADAHSKAGSPNPRPVGFVNFKTTFTIVSG